MAGHADGMDSTALLIGALLLVVGLVVGLVIGRSAPRADRPSAEMAALIGPASDALRRVENRLQEVERDRVGAYAGLREQVAALHRASTELGSQTRSLVGALRAPQVRGRWGEVQLQRVVELAGMVEHCDFDTQVSAHDRAVDGRGVRPDMVVRLSGGRSIVVDAKVPFAAWLEALDSPDDRRRAALMAAHARAVRAHVDALAAKSYWRHFQPAPEFVVMFVPGEPLIDAALAVDPGLADHAFGRHVVIATPTSLIALLRTVAFTWRQEQLSASAAEVHALGRELHGRLATVGGHLSRLGAGLERAVISYNQTVRSVETRVLVTARRFADLGVTTDELPAPEPVDVMPRRPQAADFPTDFTSDFSRDFTTDNRTDFAAERGADPGKDGDGERQGSRPRDPPEGAPAQVTPIVRAAGWPRDATVDR
ncbi:MAG TPA: DNA recombination protein RmuC [Nakamurella sp.]|nr:DNA recombination protein RmuC [Nakamurella sp.]